MSYQHVLLLTWDTLLKSGNHEYMHYITGFFNILLTLKWNQICEHVFKCSLSVNIIFKHFVLL